jgi:hypothetical protein
MMSGAEAHLRVRRPAKCPHAVEVQRRKVEMGARSVETARAQGEIELGHRPVGMKADIVGVRSHLQLPIFVFKDCGQDAHIAPEPHSPESGSRQDSD